MTAISSLSPTEVTKPQIGEMIARMKKEGVQIILPEGVPPEILAKWQACMIGLNSVIFSEVVGYMETMRPGLTEVSIPSYERLDIFLKQTEQLMTELADFPKVKLSICQALAYLINLIFLLCEGEDGTMHASEVPPLIARVLPAEDALPILFEIWPKEVCQYHMQDEVAVAISTLISTLPKGSKVQERFLRQFVKSSACFNSRGKIKTIKDGSIGLDILPHLEAFFRAHLSAGEVNNLGTGAALHYLKSLAESFADSGNHSDCQKTLEMLSKLSISDGNRTCPFDWQVSDLKKSLGKAGFNDLLPLVKCRKTKVCF
jgi:hypothetical protein